MESFKENGMEIEKQKKHPIRKRIRLEEYDYSKQGAYFVTICTKDRKKLFWDVGADIIRPKTIMLSEIGEIVDRAICQIPNHYSNVCVDQYCIMPEHIHMIIRIERTENGRMISAPTISTIVGSMKRWVSMQISFSIWQKSFINRVIRNEKGYRAVWEYIENNPIKLDTGYDMPDFENM